jgi:hypothetical protein
MGWHVGVGQGIRCWNPENRANPHPGLKIADPAPLIPSGEFVCEKFEWRRPTGETPDPKERPTSRSSCEYQELWTRGFRPKIGEF